MQTWLVHMREPAGLLRDLGLPGFLTFQLIVGDNALAALVHPPFMAALVYSVASGAPLSRGDSAAAAILATVYGVLVVVGYLTSAFLGWLGLLRRGLLSTAWILLLTPLHWLLLSLAAWRALYQLVVAPYAWEKTEHGLAKSSRLERADGPFAAVGWKRYLSALEESRRTADAGARASCHDAGRRREILAADYNRNARRRKSAGRRVNKLATAVRRRDRSSGPRFRRRPTRPRRSATAARQLDRILYLPGGQVERRTVRRLGAGTGHDLDRSCC